MWDFFLCYPFFFGNANSYVSVVIGINEAEGGGISRDMRLHYSAEWKIAIKIDKMRMCREYRRRIRRRREEKEEGKKTKKDENKAKR